MSAILAGLVENSDEGIRIRSNYSSSAIEPRTRNCIQSEKVDTHLLAHSCVMTITNY